MNHFLPPPPPPPPPIPYLEPNSYSLNYSRPGNDHARTGQTNYGSYPSSLSQQPQQLWQSQSVPFSVRPPPPPPVFHEEKERAPRVPFRIPLAKPGGLRGPWPVHSSSPLSDHDNSSRKRLAPVMEIVKSPLKPKIDARRKKKEEEVNEDSKSISVEDNEEHIVLPKVLTSKFGALKCDLCAVEVNSTVQAKMHYTGKIHEKKIGQFMQKWAKESGEPLPKRYKEGAPKKKTGEGVGSGNQVLYCKTCDLALTSQQHADQHNMGRNHKRALAGGTPLKAGYFNKALGKWQRAPPEEKPDPTGRFNIAKAFLPEPQVTDPLGLMEQVIPEPAGVNSPYTCELCRITTTSQEQLDTHYSGAKHKKAVKLAGDNWSVDKQRIPIAAAPGDSILASVVRPEDTVRNTFTGQTAAQKKDFSIYRTPSGQYYCQPCNFALNSEAQFVQHCESKKHKIKLASVKKPTSNNRSSMKL